MKNKLGKVLLTLVASGMGTLLIGWVFIPSERYLARWNQPSTVNYESYDPYVLVVSKTASKFDSIVGHDGYRLYVGQPPEDDGRVVYGHWIDFSFFPSAAEIDNINKIEIYVKKSNVNWTKKGIELVTPSGHKLFIPKEAFIGGR